MIRNRYLALLWLFLSLVPCAFAQGDPAAFRNALEQDGFYVTPGAIKVGDAATAWCEYTPNVPNAGYGNKASYLGLFVPTVAGGKQVELVPNFQIRHDEAIVLIGLTPPPAKYLAFYPWLATKVYPDGKRRAIGNTLGDSVNNLTIKTTGSTPFNSYVALIFTPDKGTDARVRTALQHAGYPAAAINTVVFPASMLNLGYGESADELTVAMRNAVWQKQADGDAYIDMFNGANPPLSILRVTPQTPGTPDPFPAPRLRVRGTGQTEMDFWNKLFELRTRIIEANPGLHATDIPTSPAIGYEGYDYMQRGILEGGDARDAFILDAGYIPEFYTYDKVTLADDEFLMIYGINHVATGKATYMNINVYSSNEGKISIGTLLDDDLLGTASPYLHDTSADLMYAYKVSRTCKKDEPGCLLLSIDNCPRLTIDQKTVLGLVFRMYLEPATKVGAAMPEILYDRVIKFSPR